MKKLLECKKITLATLKSFAQRNKENLFCRETSRFDGMTDCVQQTHGLWHKTAIKEDDSYRIGGCWLVGSSRDYFTLYEDPEYIGIEVYNCCGCSILAVKKQNRIQKMIESFKTDGRAFSNLSNDDTDFFKQIDYPYDNLGITSQTGNDLVYYNTDLYLNDSDALRMKKQVEMIDWDILLTA